MTTKQLDEILKRLDDIDKILKRLLATDTVDDVRFPQAPHKPAKEILDGYKTDRIKP